jgi:hypothetical protein
MNTGGTIRDIWHGEGRDVLTGNSGRDVCDFAGPDSASGCEARQVGGEGEIRLYTRSLVDPELGYSTPFSEAPNLSKLGEGDRAMCKTSGKVRAKLPGHMPPISDLNPSDVKTTVERTKITADPGLTVKGASSRVVTGLSTDSWTRLTWVTVEATQDAEYSIDYAVTADYNGLKQKRTFSGAMHCNTALIDANSSVREGFALFFDTTGNTKGVTFDWDVDRTSGWAFAPGTGASSPKPAIYFTDDGTYNVTLTVTTPIGRKITDTHTVTVLANRPPVAHAGPDATTRNATYQLNGAGSHDPDGDPLTSFQWTKPAGVDWEPGSGSSSVRPWIRFSDFGSYTFELEVCARGGCDTDEVRISYWPFQ